MSLVTDFVVHVMVAVFNCAGELPSISCMSDTH